LWNHDRKALRPSSLSPQDLKRVRDFDSSPPHFGFDFLQARDGCGGAIAGASVTLGRSQGLDCTQRLSMLTPQPGSLTQRRVRGGVRIPYIV